MTHEPIEPARPRWRRWLPGVVVAVVLSAAVVAGFRLADDRRHTCGDGVRKLGGTQECVGVTDGGYAFPIDDAGEQPRMARVLGLIAEENRQLRESGAPWVSIAYLLPMPWHGQGSLPPQVVVHQLYGAYAAQVEANEGTNGAGSPKVRLLIANTGHDGLGWEPVVASILERRRDDRIAVVAGLGQSLDTVERAAQRLSAAALPMVGSTITADNLNGRNYPHLYRVSPTNNDEVAIGLRYLRGLAVPTGDRPNATFLVASGNPADSYVEELRRAFRAAFKDNFSTRTFDPHAQGYTQVLERSAADVCNRDSPVTVYFAGRSEALRIFLAGLGGQCDPRQQVTILSGDDTSGLTGHPDDALTAALSRKAIRLFYTGLTHPGQWGATPPAQLTRLVTILKSKTDNTVPDLADGHVIMGYDAVTVSTQAVRGVAPTEQDLAHLDSLTNGFEQINDGSPYCGASGPIALETDRPEARGNTVNKPIPVIQVAADGSATFRALHYPVATGWNGRCGAPPQTRGG